MHKRKFWLEKFLLFLLLIRNGTCSASVVKSAWKSISINASIFEDSSYQNEIRTTDSEIKCVLIANNLRWPNVLYFNNGLCHLATAHWTSCLDVLIDGPGAVAGKWMFKGRLTYHSLYDRHMLG